MIDRPTIGVAMIVKNDVSRVATLYEALKEYVDAFYITVSDKEAFEKIEKIVAGNKDRVNYRKWSNDFAAARNFNHGMINTDYWIWLDDDDILRGRENLRDMVEDMHNFDVDLMMLPYHYKMNENGETVTLQWRERIVKTSLEGKWEGIVHETFVPSTPPKMHKTDGVSIYHIKSEKQFEESVQRNHELLLLAHEKNPTDYRYTHYLAISYAAIEDYDNAIKKFLEHIEHSGWPEEIYRGWVSVADCLCNLEKYDEEVDAAMQAVKLLPHYPDAYYALQQAYHHMEEYGKSLEWFSMAESKDVPETNAANDPTVYTYRGKLMAVMGLMSIGEPSKAYSLMLEVQKVAPKDKMFKELMPIVVQAHYEASAIDKAKWLMSYEGDAKGDPLKVLQSLPKGLQGDPRLREAIAANTPPIEWGKKSIVFYCGPGLEFWGPDTLDKGMGGSEEAVVYLSRALAKLGWDVIVYNDREKEYYDELIVETSLVVKDFVDQEGSNGHGGLDSATVTYKPWTLFNPKDTFDVLVAWRNPDFHRELETKARVRAIDMHDTPVGHQHVSEENLACIDKVFLKSQYQLDMAPEYIKPKAVVISNGVVKEQFKQGDK